MISYILYDHFEIMTFMQKFVWNSTIYPRTNTCRQIEKPANPRCVAEWRDNILAELHASQQVLRGDRIESAQEI